MFLYVDLIFRLFGLHPRCDGLAFCNDFQKGWLHQDVLLEMQQSCCFPMARRTWAGAPLSHCLLLEPKFVGRFDPLVAHAALLPRRSTPAHLTGFFQGAFAAVAPSATSIIVFSGLKSVSVLNVVQLLHSNAIKPFIKLFFLSPLLLLAKINVNKEYSGSNSLFLASA